MAIPHAVRRGVVAVLLLIAFVLQGTTSVLAGTTGAISGSVVDPQSNQPVAGARVTATSPSQSVTTTSDAGRTFLVHLAQPRHVHGVGAGNVDRDAASISGVTVQADQTITVTLQQPTKLKVIGSVTSRAAAALVKPGTTADVYSINSVTQDKASGVGGGGNLNSAWSAIATVPGVFIANNQAGYIGAGATISIRGGDYDQIGYELDGVPVNRAFDNYPSGPISSLGQQELQVYTGAPAANAEAERHLGLHQPGHPHRHGAGVAQPRPGDRHADPLQQDLVRSGRRQPGAHVLVLHRCGRVQPELPLLRPVQRRQPAAGLGRARSRPARTRTPIGCHGPHGQDYTNGGQSDTYSWALGPYNAFSGVRPVHSGPRHGREPALRASAQGRQPRRHPAAVRQQLHQQSRPELDQRPGRRGLPAGDRRVPRFLRRRSVLRRRLPLHRRAERDGASGGIRRRQRNRRQPYLLPGLAPRAPVPRADRSPNRRDAFDNNQSIVKLQYQRNFGTNAFLRVYGYTYYSDWLQNGPQSALQNNLGISGRSTCSTATPAASARSSRTSSTRSTCSRFRARTRRRRRCATTTRASAHNPVSGSAGGLGESVQRDLLRRRRRPGNSRPVRVRQRFTPATVHRAAQAVHGHRHAGEHVGSTCGGGPCAYVVGNTGVCATYNTVVPKFASASITDQWKPTDRLNINLGLRYDSFVFQGADTTNSPARTLFYNAYNLVHPTAQRRQRAQPGRVVQHPAAAHRHDLHGQSAHGAAASYGRYAEAPNSAFEQYNYLQPNDVAAARALRPLRSADDAGPPGPAVDREQLRLLLRAPVPRRHLAQVHAVPPQDAGSDPAVLPRSAHELRLGAERRQADLARLRARSRQGRLLAQRPRRRACRSPTPTATSTTRAWATGGSIVDPINAQIRATTRTPRSAPPIRPTRAARRAPALRPRRRATPRPAPPIRVRGRARSRTRTGTLRFRR